MQKKQSYNPDSTLDRDFKQTNKDYIGKPLHHHEEQKHGVDMFSKNIDSDDYNNDRNDGFLKRPSDHPDEIRQFAVDPWGNEEKNFKWADGGNRKARADPDSFGN